MNRKSRKAGQPVMIQPQVGKWETAYIAPPSKSELRRRAYMEKVAEKRKAELEND